MVLLSIENISKSFDGISVLKNLSLSIEKKDIVLLEGENGAGKSTIFNLITQMNLVDKGLIKFKGESIQGLSPLAISRRGIIRLHQDPRVFKNLTVAENLFCSVDYKNDVGFFSQIIYPRKTKQLEIKTKEKANLVLQNLKLKHLSNALVGSLSYGQQKLIAFAMIAMTDAELILLDEPFAGLNSNMIEELIDFIKHLNQEGKTFVIIEHNINQAKEISNKRIVLENGIAINKNLDILC